MVEENKMNFQVSEYSVAQTSLEQIFNNFAASAELKQQFKRRNSVRRSQSGSFKEGMSAEGGDIEMSGTSNPYALKTSVHLQRSQVMP